MTPWEWLAAASLEVMEAARTDDAERHAAALNDLDDAKDAVGMLGCMLFKYATERGALAFQRQVSLVFGGLARFAFEKAKAAEKRANWAVRKMDALEQRVREMERRLEAKAFGRTA